MAKPRLSDARRLSAVKLSPRLETMPSAGHLAARSKPQAPTPKPPTAAKTPKRIEQLGRVRVDDYAWMKDDNWQKVLRDPALIRADVKQHLTEENAYTQAMLADTQPLQDQLFKEMKGRIKEDDASVPQPD